MQSRTQKCNGGDVTYLINNRSKMVSNEVDCGSGDGEPYQIDNSGEGANEW